MLLVGVGSLVQFFQTRELSWVPLRAHVRHSSKQPSGQYVFQKIPNPEMVPPFWAGLCQLSKH